MGSRVAAIMALPFCSIILPLYLQIMYLINSLLGRSNSVLTSMENTLAALETPERPQTLVGVMSLEKKLNRNALYKLFTGLVEKQPRLRMTFRPHKILPHVHEFAEISGFDLEKCLHYIDIEKVSTEFAGEGGKVNLESVVQTLMNKPIDTTVGLWEAFLIDNVDGGSAIYLKLHHVLADGMSANIMLMTLCRDKDGSEITNDSISWKKRNPNAGRKDSFESHSYHGVHSNLEKMFNTLISLIARILFFPIMVPYILWRLLRYFSSPFFSSTTFKAGFDLKDEQGDRSKVNKCFAWSSDIDLDEVKEIKNHFKCTINDVMSAAATGALRRYLSKQLGTNKLEDCICHMPVSLHKSLDVDQQVSNSVCGVWVDLPISVENPVERLYVTNERMNAIKNFPVVIAVQGILVALTAFIPASICRFLVRLALDRTLCIMTNVPGPQLDLYVGGCKVSKLHAFGLQATDGGLGLAILSFGGKIAFTVLADEGIVDPQVIVDGLKKEIELYHSLVVKSGQQ
eukprot:Nk52_evm25s914 gene=Nk52_evmTU25s914